MSVEISIVLITCDRARLLRGAVASLLAQQLDSRWSYELIVVDDGSHDETPAVLEELPCDRARADAGRPDRWPGRTSSAEPGRAPSRGPLDGVLRRRPGRLASLAAGVAANRRTDWQSLCRRSTGPADAGKCAVAAGASCESAVRRAPVGSRSDPVYGQVAPGEQQCVDRSGSCSLRWAALTNGLCRVARIQTCLAGCRVPEQRSGLLPAPVLTTFCPHTALPCVTSAGRPSKSARRVPAFCRHGAGSRTLSRQQAGDCVIAVLRDVPLWCVGEMFGSRTRVLEARCSLWYTQGLLRGLIAVHAPHVPGVDRFLQTLNFRNHGRRAGLSGVR